MRRLIPITATLIVAISVCSLLTQRARTQEIAPGHPVGPVTAGGFHSAASNLIIPQSRAYSLRPHAQLIQITEVAADVRIVHQVATTTLEVGLTNPSAQQQEAEMLVPVPEGAVLRGFDFVGTAKEPTAKLLPKAEATAIYRSIVSKLRDPALLERLAAS